MEMMGIASSQPATQSQAAGGFDEEMELPTARTGSSVQATPPEKARGRGKGKLKTYSGKKQRSSLGKTRVTVADDEEEEADARHQPVAKASSELSDPTSPQPKRARARGRRIRDEVEDAPAVAVAAPVEENNTPDAEIAQFSQNSKRREAVNRSRNLLKDVRRARKSQPGAGEESPSTQLTADHQGPTPPATGQISDAAKVSTWLSHGAGSSQAVSSSAPAPQGVDPASHGYGALLHNGKTPAQEEEAEDDDDDENEIYAEPREYASDSGDDYEPEPEPEQAPISKTKTKTKSKSATKTANTKRKRDSTEAAATAAPPAKKRQRKSEPTDAAEPTSQPPSRATSARPGVDNFPSAGPFTPVEVGLVEGVFEDTRKALAISRPQMIFKVQKSDKDISAMLTTITQDILPNRNRKAVQRFCRRHFNDHQRGPWTPEQDEMLTAAFTENPQKWKFIGERVGRMPEDCRDRWRNHLSLAETRHTDVWTHDEELILCKAIRDSIIATKKTIANDIPATDEDSYIAWHVVVKKMGGLRNRLQCTNKWKKLRQRANRPVENLEIQALSKEDKRLQKAQGRKSFKHLRMGDMYAMLKEVQYSGFIGRIEHPATFWAVVTKMHPTSPYTTVERKLAFKTTKQLVEDSGDFHRNINAIVERLEQPDFEEKLKERVRVEKSDKERGAAVRRSGKKFTSAEKVAESDDETAEIGPSRSQENGVDDEEEEEEEEEEVDEMEIDEGSAEANAGAVDEREVGSEEEEEEEGDPSAAEDEEEEGEEEENNDEVPESEDENEDQNTPVPEPRNGVDVHAEVPESPRVSESASPSASASDNEE